MLCSFAPTPTPFHPPPPPPPAPPPHPTRPAPTRWPLPPIPPARRLRAFVTAHGFSNPDITGYSAVSVARQGASGQESCPSFHNAVPARTRQNSAVGGPPTVDHNPQTRPRPSRPASRRPASWVCPSPLTGDLHDRAH